MPSKNIVPYKADMEPLYGTVRFRTVAPIDVLRTVLLLSTTDERAIVGITLRMKFVYISLILPISSTGKYAYSSLPAVADPVQ